MLKILFISLLLPITIFCQDISSMLLEWKDVHHKRSRDYKFDWDKIEIEPDIEFREAFFNRRAYHWTASVKKALLDENPFSGQIESICSMICSGTVISSRFVFVSVAIIKPRKNIIHIHHTHYTREMQEWFLGSFFFNPF